MVEKQLNYRLVLGLLGGLLVVCTIVHFVHGYQVSRHAGSLRTQAELAEKAGQPDKTIVLLERYLTFTPGDTESLEHFGKLLDKQARGTSARWRVVKVYEQVLDRKPERTDLRRRVVELQMSLDAYSEANRHLDILLVATPHDGDLENLLGQCQEGQGDSEQAVVTYEKAIAHAPRLVAAHAHLAALLRRLDKPARADDVMDTLVRTNPQLGDAHLERGLYRLANGLVEPAGLDLERARELAPDDPRVLVASAELFHRLGDDDGARKSWEDGRGKYPNDLTMILGLATLDMQTGRAHDAVACLNIGLELAPGNPDVLHLLTEAYLQRKQTDKARETVAKVNQRLEPELHEYLTARVLQSDGQWAGAIYKFDRTARNPDVGTALRSRAWLALGDCYLRLGDADRQVSAYQSAVALEPALEPARYGLGSAYLALGRVEDALEQYRKLADLPHPPETVWVLLARTLFQRNLSLPPGKRTWEEVDRALDRAAKEPSQAVAAALLRADTLVARDDWKKAAAVLEDVRKQHPDAVGAWTALATQAARQGDLAAGNRVLAEARTRFGDNPELVLVELEFRSGQDGAAVERYLHGVEKASADYPPADKARVLARVAEAYYRLGKAADGDRLCKQLAERSGLDLQEALTLLDLILQSGDDALQQAFLAQLKTLEGAENGTWWRYGEAAHAVLRAWRGDRSRLPQARTLLAEIEQRRPAWARGTLLGALLDDLGGDTGKALDGYLRAFEQGERQPAMVRQLVRRLAEAGRFLDADQVVRKVQQQLVLRGDFARLAAEVAQRTRQFDRAATLARQAIPPGSRDYASYLWLGQLLAACDRGDEAEEVYRQAVALADDVPDVWVALVAHQVHLDRVPAAEEAIAAMQMNVAADRREVALGVCYEALGRWSLAEQHYVTARQELPRDALPMQRLAIFHLRRNQPAKAEPMLRALTDPANAVPKESVAWARRELALLRAWDGDAGYREATELLDRNRQDGVISRAEQRALDLIRATRSADARRATLRALGDTLTAYPLGVDEELFVARLYEAEDDWPRQRDHLLNVLAADPKNPEYLAFFIKSLLGRGKKDEARSWVAKLEKMEPDSDRVKRFRVEIGQRSETP